MATRTRFRRRPRRPPQPVSVGKLGTTYDQGGNVVPDPIVTNQADVADITVTAPSLTAPNIFMVGAAIALAWWLWNNLDFDWEG